MNTHTHTQTKYCNPRCACIPRFNELIQPRDVRIREKVEALYSAVPSVLAVNSRAHPQLLMIIQSLEVLQTENLTRGDDKWSTVDREIFVLKIFCALKFHGAKFS